MQMAGGLAIFLIIFEKSHTIIHTNIQFEVSGYLAHTGTSIAMHMLLYTPHQVHPK